MTDTAEKSIEQAYEKGGGMNQDQRSQAIGDRPCPNEVKGSGAEPNSGTLNGEPNK